MQIHDNTQRWPFWCANFGQEDLRGVSNILDYSKDRKEDRSEGRKIGSEMLSKEKTGIYESRVVHKSVLYYGKRGRTRDDFANMLRSEWRIENQRSMPVTYMRKAGFGRFREVGFVERSSYPFRIVGLAKFKGRHHREKDVRLQFRKSPGSSVFTVVPR
ncbi:hypothetical protein V1477_018693 [Vespula maculifrons]|uniref:Uncharacterized protein n=1 Tax=Vespula maculifrons TaxID=7453 RepID=A0ABD2AW34_VESMC